LRHRMGMKNRSDAAPRAQRRSRPLLRAQRCWMLRSFGGVMRARTTRKRTTVVRAMVRAILWFGFRVLRTPVAAIKAPHITRRAGIRLSAFIAYVVPRCWRHVAPGVYRRKTVHRLPCCWAAQHSLQRCTRVRSAGSSRKRKTVRFASSDCAGVWTPLARAHLVLNASRHRENDAAQKLERLVPRRGEKRAARNGASHQDNGIAIV